MPKGYSVPGVEEEGDPVFCLVEDFGEEDEVGSVIGGGLDVDASQLHILRAGQFGLYISWFLLPLMCLMVENGDLTRFRKLQSIINHYSIMLNPMIY